MQALPVIQLTAGYTEYTVADARFCFLLDDHAANQVQHPCSGAGLIGFRSYKMIDSAAKNIGLYGFGAAAAYPDTFSVQAKTFFVAKDGIRLQPQIHTIDIFCAESIIL